MRDTLGNQRKDAIQEINDADQFIVWSFQESSRRLALHFSEADDDKKLVTAVRAMRALKQWILG